MGTTRGKRDPVKSTLKGWMDPSASPPLPTVQRETQGPHPEGEYKGRHKRYKRMPRLNAKSYASAPRTHPRGRGPRIPATDHRRPAPGERPQGGRRPPGGRGHARASSLAPFVVSPLPPPPSPVWRGEGALLRVGPVRCHLTERRAGRHRSGLVPPHCRPTTPSQAGVNRPPLPAPRGSGAGPDRGGGAHAGGRRGPRPGRGPAGARGVRRAGQVGGGSLGSERRPRRPPGLCFDFFCLVAAGIRAASVCFFCKLCNSHNIA